MKSPDAVACEEVLQGEVSGAEKMSGATGEDIWIEGGTGKALDEIPPEGSPERYEICTDGRIGEIAATAWIGEEECSSYDAQLQCLSQMHTFQPFRKCWD